jgi:hypothetical protein
MLSNEEILNEVKDSDLDQTLFEELLEEHDDIRKAYNRKDYEKTLNKTGKFCETTYQLLQEILEDKHDTQPNFNGIKDDLEDEPKADYAESIRILIPRVAKAMYDFRSKRGGAHKIEIDHQYIDAHLNVQTSRWIVAEFLRVYGDGDVELETLEAQVQQLATRSIPLVEEFPNGDVMVLHDPDSAKEEAMMILYHFYPDRITLDRLEEIMDSHSRNNIRTNLNNAENNQRHVHRGDEGYILTEKGRKYIENTYGEEAEEVEE